MTPEEVLDSLKIQSYQDVYYVGTANRGITIYKQQVRALNLIYSLQKSGKIMEGSRVSIIGGGIAGITASAACLEIGCKVILYEKKPILIHLQTGCKTRWVHPHIYDWPQAGSEFPYAGLPLLNWKEGYASDVAQHLLKEYRRTTNKFRNNYTEFLGSSFSINFSDRSIDQYASIDLTNINSQYDYEVLVLTSGFGLELGVLNRDTLAVEDTISYWRNDDLDQPYLGFQNSTKKTIVISGTGDGALIDILRSTLTNFHQGRLIGEILSCCPDQNQLKDLISNIKIKYEKEKSINPNKVKNSAWLNHEFSDLPQSLLSPIKEYLKSQHRIDTSVYLLGKHIKMYDVLNVQRMSIFNAFIIYMLYALDFFTYYGVDNIKKIKAQSRRIRIKLIRPDRYNRTEVFINYNTFVSRHGHQKGIEEMLKDLGIIDFKFTNNTDTSIRIWEAGWPNIYIKNSKEFVPPTTRTISTTFIETLASNLLDKHKYINPSFRLTFERFIEIGGSAYFQQVSRYAGTSARGSNETIGRVFPAQYGIVGFTAMIGKPILLVRNHDFDKVVILMETIKLQAHDIRDELKSMLCIPIFSPKQDTNELHINSAIYIDSSEIDFFSEDVINTITNSCQGFIQALEKMRKNCEINVSENKFQGVKVKPLLEDLTNYSSLKIGEEITPSLINSRLTFDIITSFDIYEQD